MTTSKQNLKIGMFDSGVGGLSILSSVHELMSDLEIFYIADSAFCPYGEKKQTELIKRASEITGLLLKQKASLVVLACNTITAAAIKDLRNQFKIPFVGVEPYLNAYNKEDGINESSKLAVLTTTYTAASEKFLVLKNRLDPDNLIHHVTSSKLAMLVEDIFHHGFDEEKKKLVRNELNPLKDRGFTHVILGCTHYILISSFIEKYLNVRCISPEKPVARRIKDVLEDQLNYQPNDQSLKKFWYMDTQNGQWVEKDFGGLSIKSPW